MPPPRASDSATNPCYRPTHDPGVNEAWDDPVAALRLRSLVPKVTPTQTTINDLMIQGTGASAAPSGTPSLDPAGKAILGRGGCLGRLGWDSADDF